MLTTFPVSIGIARYGYQHTLAVYGLVLGVVGIIAALGMRLPPPGYMSDWQPRTGAVADYRTSAMLRTPLFWLMFVMMSMMATSGLMVTSQMAVFTRDFGLAGVTVFGLAALPLALTIDRVANGVTRPLFGGISDLIGRTVTFVALEHQLGRTAAVSLVRPKLSLNVSVSPVPS
jgi:OFA family oxalate/formate antiporter-like MFS transporter